MHRYLKQVIKYIQLDIIVIIWSTFVKIAIRNSVEDVNSHAKMKNQFITVRIVDHDHFLNLTYIISLILFYFKQ